MLSSGLRIPLLSPLLLLLLAEMELSWSFTDEEKKQIVDQHNLYRSMVSPSAANMRKMRWDSELEAFAKNYSTKCTWEHNKERGYRGENLFAMSGNLDLEKAVEDWYIEYQYYNYSTLACIEGKMCGHYTQVVWATSERVGCGTTGNIRGHKPYILGDSCSMCPDGYSCNNNLCDSTPDVGETTVLPTAPELETTTILTASPSLQSIITVSAEHIPGTPQIGTETGSEPPTTDDQGTASGSQIGTKAQPIATEGPDVVSDLQAGTDGIDESLMTTTSATSFVNLIRSSISPEMGTKTTTGTEHPSSADDLITTQTSLIKTERPVTTLTTTKTVSTPKLPSVPKPPSVTKPPSDPKPTSVPKPPSVPKPTSVPKPPPVPKPPSVPKPTSVPKPHFVPKPPFIPKPHFFPKPPPIPIKRPISKKPARHRLMAYSKAIRSSSNSFQSSAACGPERRMEASTKGKLYQNL
ncbi:Peptidase inhibitor 16, partial [Ophiophagus hannah]